LGGGGWQDYGGLHPPGGGFNGGGGGQVREKKKVALMTFPHFDQKFSAKRDFKSRGKKAFLPRERSDKGSGGVNLFMDSYPKKGTSPQREKVSLILEKTSFLERLRERGNDSKGKEERENHAISTTKAYRGIC